MSEMLLLGAGASVEAGIPGALDMTKSIVANLRANPRFEKEAHALSYVVGGLLFEAGKNNVNPLAPAINVEDLFNAVQLLAERSTLEAAPFIGSWHSFIEELDTIHPSQPQGNMQRLIYNVVAKEILSAFSQNPPTFGTNKIDSTLASNIKKIVDATIKGRSASLSSSDSVGAAIERYIKDLTGRWSTKLKHPSLSGIDNIERQISQRIKASQTHSGQGQIFQQITELMIAALKDLVWIDDAKKVVYLSPLLNILKQQDRLVIATLNYDNSIELLSTSQNVQCQTGISEWSVRGDFEMSGAGLHLLKLHGSVDWLRRDEGGSNERMPVIGIEQLAPDQVKRPELRPAVIFGNRNKLTAEGPFLDLLRAFQDELTRSEVLTVVGYSFRDPHINVYISKWLNGDTNRILRIVNGPDFNDHLRFELNSLPYVRKLLDFAGASPRRVQIVGQYAGDGLKTLYGESVVSVLQSPEVADRSALERLAEKIETEDESSIIDEIELLAEMIETEGESIITDELDDKLDNDIPVKQEPESDNDSPP